MPAKNSHCSYCGAPFAEGQPWPRRCAACGNVSYVNPLPVAVLLVPVGGEGLLLVRRAIEPRKGQLALPGGFIGVGESWQVAGAREVLEETGITVDASQVSLFDALSAPDGTLLVFGLAPAIAASDVPATPPEDEVSELVIVTGPVPLAFPLHDAVADRYWRERMKAA